MPIPKQRRKIQPPLLHHPIRLNNPFLVRITQHGSPLLHNLHPFRVRPKNQTWFSVEIRLLLHPARIRNNHRRMALQCRHLQE